MGEILPLIIIFWVITSVMGLAKSKQQKNAKQEHQKQTFRMLKDEFVRQFEDQEVEKPTSAPVQAAVKPPVQTTMSESWTDKVNEDVHRGKRNNLHPTEQVMSSRLLDIATERVRSMSDEGKDDCHAYMLDDPSLPACHDELDGLQNQTEAPFSLHENELLRGVVMAEILTRPCQRKPLWRHP